MKVLFVHGLGGLTTPKATYFKNNVGALVPWVQHPFNLVASLFMLAKAIREYKPDVVAGSSFGGFILLLLMQLGEWKGPAVLFCPATGKLFPSRLWLPKNTVCTLAHGRTDIEIRVEDSRKVYASANPQSHVKYIENDDDHSLVSLDGDIIKELLNDVSERYAIVNKNVKPKLSRKPLWLLRIQLIVFVAYNFIRNIVPIIKATLERRKLKR